MAPGILWLRMPLPFALDHINLWLLAEDDGLTLVDCGYGDAATRALWEPHFATTLRGRPLARIVATHCHPDHLGNAAWLAGALRLRGHDDARRVPDRARDHRRARVARPRRHVRAVPRPRHGRGRRRRRCAARGNHYRRGVPDAPADYDRLLAGDTHASPAARAWRVIIGHGHSPEHASLFAPAHDVLISGDMLLPKISTNVSVWPSEPDGDPLGRFLDSLAAFEDLPPDTLVLPSHGLPFRGIPLRVAQLRAHHDARLAELREADRARRPRRSPPRR